MSTIRFIEQADRYSVYEQRDGERVYVAHGFPRVFLVDFDTSWMLRQWALQPPVSHSGPADVVQDAFLDWMREHLLDPDDVDEIRFCERCTVPVHTDDASRVEGDGWACESCVSEHYRTCEDCSEICPDTTYTLHDEIVCDSCRGNNYSYCDECDGYYHDNGFDEHEHDNDCEGECESPKMTFAIRNDGKGMLWNDDRLTVSVPTGTLDAEGVARIVRYLRGEDMHEAAALVHSMDARWQTKQGNFTKRLSRALYQKHGTKITPDVLSTVGSIARDHSQPVEFVVATTRDLNMSASDFGNSASCYWQSSSASRCTLKSNGAFGLRSFDSDGEVTGRAWVMPLVLKDGDLEATFNTETPDAFVVFNCYGELEGYAAARIISHMAGMTYRKVSFEASPMYINGQSAYLVASEDIASKYTDGRLFLSVSEHSNLYAIEKAAAKELVNA